MKTNLLYGRNNINLSFYHHRLLFVLLSLLLISVGYAQATLATTTSPLVERLERIVTAYPLKGNVTVAIYVEDAVSGKVLVNRLGERPLKPASCNKLLTTAAGLTLLGPAFTFHTYLYADAPITTPTLRANLYIVGGGDPTISGRFEPDKRDVTAPLRRWADALTSLGVTRIEGNILADDSLFDKQYFHPTWYPDERGEWYEAEVSALAFNDNCVDLLWSGESGLPGNRAALTINPPTRYARVRNEVRLIAAGRPAGRFYIRKPGSNDILATGTLNVGARKDDSASIDNGALYFATVFQEVLTSAGIKVTGKPRHVRYTPTESRRHRRALIAERVSPPLSEVVKVINLVSQNFYAECLVKMLGRQFAGEGSFKAGCKVVSDFIRNNHIYHEGHRMVDGSGLSEGNRVSARQLVETIRFMDKGPHRAEWRASLPVGGVRGSLRARFQQTSATQALAPNIMGKTGLIDKVRSLSGIATTVRGDERYYSIIVNGFEGGGDRVIRMIDELALAIVDEEGVVMNSTTTTAPLSHSRNTN
ncbi:MAG: D-alanyl-D-alanine carboxypeptidase/D-alanyl-D-alanine-endopeptidase [Candidatus Sumerlaeaceae bacterium]|nr:D-alanyl-D-alanine carboxypeptidase/D-alanyl-D-alanine-endopeptidase [Candidatus Sumerlaeaceae bacterium]